MKSRSPRPSTVERWSYLPLLLLSRGGANFDVSADILIADCDCNEAQEQHTGQPVWSYYHRQQREWCVETSVTGQPVWSYITDSSVNGASIPLLLGRGRESN